MADKGIKKQQRYKQITARQSELLTENSSADWTQISFSIKSASLSICKQIAPICP